MKRPKKSFFSSKKLTFLLLGTFLVMGIAIIAIIILFPPSTNIKNETADVLKGIPSLPDELTLPKDQLTHTFTSPELEAKFTFNAIAPLWQEKDAQQDHPHLELRVSDDGSSWTDWMEVETTPTAKDTAVATTKYFPETPLFIEGRYFQYRITLARNSLTEAAPTITDVQMNYIDSRPSVLQKVSASLQNIFWQKAAATTPTPAVISRAGWGSPDPHGDLFKGTDRYWAPAYAPTKQVFLHHTVSANTQSDPKAIVRGIWDYHTNTLGWGDIGYNYLVDYLGNIYEGRFGGDTVTAGHTKDYNTGSLGVSVLGCFEPDSSACRTLNNNNTTPPTPATIEKLATLLSWKTSSYGINPDVTHTFCKYDDSGCLSIPTIAAHRQAFPTECNGQLFYDKMNAIRQKVVEKNSQNLWGVHHVEFMQKSNFGNTQQLFYGTRRLLYASMWGSGYSGISTKTLMQAPVGEQFVSVHKITRLDGTTQTIFVATQSAVYEITLTGTTFSDPIKRITHRAISKIAAEVRNESGEETQRVYVLGDDGPYEYWWREGTGVSDGFRLWNINGGIDMVKSTDPNSKDELYVASKSEVYRMKWPINSDIERKLVTSLTDTVGIDKQNLPGGTELLYTATKTGVHETWWKPGTGFSNPAKIVQTGGGQQVVDIKKTLTNGYQQLYVAENGYVREYWWGPNSGGIKSGQLIRISQNTITEIDKTTTGSYQNLYTASQSFIFETWWGNGRFGNGPAIIQIGK